MLQQLQLTYLIQNEVLFITTPEAADQELRICVYDVREIVGPAKDQSVDELIDAVVACVASESWAENGGGEAEIRWLQPGFLVISQMQAVRYTKKFMPYWQQLAMSAGACRMPPPMPLTPRRPLPQMPIASRRGTTP